MLAMPDRTVEIVHGTSRDRDDQAPARAQQLAGEPHCALRRFQVLDYFAADDGVGRPAKLRLLILVIEIDELELRPPQAFCCDRQRGRLRIESDQLRIGKGASDPLQQRATSAAEVDYDGRLRQVLKLAYHQPPAMPLRRTELVRQRKVAPQLRVFFGVAHRSPSPRRARIWSSLFRIA